jgi:glycosyltransferase involved in cell wall biosynthesis
MIPLPVDNWALGRRSHGVQAPLLEAMAGMDSLDLRGVISDANADLAAYRALPLPMLVLPTAAGASRLPGLAARLLPARRRLSRSSGMNGRLVHVTMWSPWDLFYLPVAKRAGAKLLLTVHDVMLHPGEEHWLKQAAWDKVIRLADHIAVLSRHVADELEQRRVSAKPVHVIPTGHLTTAGPLLAPRAFPAGRPLRLLFFGRIIHYKGLDLLLDAVARLRREAVPVHLTIAGAGDYAPYRAQLNALDCVTVLDGWISVEDKNRLFAENDVNMLPYREASQSGNALDGLFAAMPTIATRSGGLVEQLGDGTDTIFTPTISADDIAEGVRALAADPALFEKLSAGARASAMNRGSGRAAEDWAALYREIASS